MKSDRCQNISCQNSCCTMSPFVNAIDPDKLPLQEEGLARASSLPEIASLVELVKIGSMTKEEAIVATDSYSIGNVLREAVSFSSDHQDLDALEDLLTWCDTARELKIFAQDTAYLPERTKELAGTAGLLLSGEENWLAGGHLKEIYEEWALQYSADRPGGQQLPNIVLRERLLYRWKGHLETILYRLDEGVLCVALVSSNGRMGEDSCGAEILSDLRDIQLEALFRAALACERQGHAHKLEILVPYPTNTEEWNFAHDLIERVAEETCVHQHCVVSFSIGALVKVDVNRQLADDLAKVADLIVIDCSENAHTWSQQVSAQMETLARQIRKSNSRLPLRVLGLRNTADLPALYRAGIEGIGVESGLIPAFRLAAAQVELQGKARKQEKAY